DTDPTRSMRKLAKDPNVDESSNRNAVGKLGMYSYVLEVSTVVCLGQNRRVNVDNSHQLAEKETLVDHP
ncbi:Hypothetical protein FKW44_007637, partial [Caligus rogercresseyi]